MQLYMSVVGYFCGQIVCIVLATAGRLLLQSYGPCLWQTISLVLSCLWQAIAVVLACLWQAVAIVPWIMPDRDRPDALLSNTYFFNPIMSAIVAVLSCMCQAIALVLVFGKLLPYILYVCSSLQLQSYHVCGWLLISCLCLQWPISVVLSRLWQAIDMSVADYLCRPVMYMVGYFCSSIRDYTYSISGSIMPVIGYFTVSLMFVTEYVFSPMSMYLGYCCSPLMSVVGYCCTPITCLQQAIVIIFYVCGRLLQYIPIII